MENVLVIGYGSIGRRHTSNLISLGIKPYVMTDYPDQSTDVHYVRNLDEIPDIEQAIVASPTVRHFSDFKQILKKTKCSKLLIEKPVDATLKNAKEIHRLSSQRGIDVNVAYNMRFLGVFDLLRNRICSVQDSIRLVSIVAGQYLPEWRPHRPYQESYSAHSHLGGGVDLDLSHEIDYMLWLFGFPDQILYTWRGRVSSLEIDSHDIFKGLYRYPRFLAEIELDYFRKKRRTLDITGENRSIASVNFIDKSCQILDETVSDERLFDMNQSYVEELREFLGMTPRNKLCTLQEAIKVMKLINARS